MFKEKFSRFCDVLVLNTFFFYICNSARLDSKYSFGLQERKGVNPRHVARNFFYSEVGSLTNSLL
jgi:hypothetical protein